jgi:nitrate reductase NapE component
LANAEERRKLESTASKTEKVTVLVTVESLIAGFMIAYGALNMQMLTYWAEPGHCGSPVSTFMAGLVVYGIVLTCFASILFLFWSLRVNGYDARYTYGWVLFTVTIFVSAIYVLQTVISIHDFTVYNSTIVSNSASVLPSCGRHLPKAYSVTEANQWYQVFWVYVCGLTLVSASIAIWTMLKEWRVGIPTFISSSFETSKQLVERESGTRLKKEWIFFWLLLVVVFAILVVAWVTRGNEFAIFLATAIGVIASTAFTFYQQHLRMPELRIHLDPDKHARQLAILEPGTGKLIDEFRFVYLQVENVGNLVAKNCVGQMRILEWPKGCTMFSDESKRLKWVEIFQEDSVYPHRGTALLGVAFSKKTPLPALPDRRCALQPGDTIVRAWADTYDMISLANPNLRLQDAFCTGDFEVRITISSSNSDPIFEDFIVQVTDNWENLKLRKAQ